MGAKLAKLLGVNASEIAYQDIRIASFMDNDETLAFVPASSPTPSNPGDFSVCDGTMRSKKVLSAVLVYLYYVHRKEQRQGV